MRRPAIGGWRLRFAVACFAFIAEGYAVAQGYPVLQISGSDSSNPIDSVQYFDDGSISSWGIEIADGRDIQIIGDSERRLLALEIRLDDRDITGEIVWNTISNTAERRIEFVGRHDALGLRILRTYLYNNNKPALLTSIRFEFENVINEGQLEAALLIPNALTTHISNDNSFGDYFYGHKKTYFSEDSSADQLYNGDEAIFADSITFSSRHIGLQVNQPNVSSAKKIRLSPNIPAMINLRVPLRTETNYVPNQYLIDFELVALPLMSSSVANTNFEFMLYTDMWAPLRILAQLIERVIQGLQSIFGSLGMAVIAFALILRMLLLPISIWSVRQQNSFSAIQEVMAPRMKEISATLKGAEKSERTLELYKEHRVSPFTGLKGSAALFIQLPILIAFFAVTTESALFRDIPFMWFADLSLPDRTFHLPFTIPVIGSYVNFMPIILGLVSVLASVIQQKSAVSSPSGFSRGAIFMVLLIIVFFYSCASALVLYWTVVNIAQILEGRYVRIRDNTTTHFAKDSSRSA